jgi:hypothetical protein
METGEGRAMSFTVAHTDGPKEPDYAAYFRLLGKAGLDISDLKRALDPHTGRRWLPVWEQREDAEDFARRLGKEARNGTWRVEALNPDARISRGPLGPLEVIARRQADGWAFELETFSRIILRKLFPGAERPSVLFIGWPRYPDLETTRCEIGRLADTIILILTGLNQEEFRSLFGGYRIGDRARGEDWLASPFLGDH